MWERRENKKPSPSEEALSRQMYGNESQLEAGERLCRPFTDWCLEEESSADRRILWIVVSSFLRWVLLW